MHVCGTGALDFAGGGNCRAGQNVGSARPCWDLEEGDPFAFAVDCSVTLGKSHSSSIKDDDHLETVIKIISIVHGVVCGAVLSTFLALWRIKIYSRYFASRFTQTACQG